MHSSPGVLDRNIGMETRSEDGNAKAKRTTIQISEVLLCYVIPGYYYDSRKRFQSAHLTMKLQSALKLYISLYSVCFVITWIISGPMLKQVSQSTAECLLFVNPYLHYGRIGGCNFIAYGSLFVALGSFLLILFHCSQLKKVRRFSKQDNAHPQQSKPIFWRVILFHSIITILVLILTAVLTAGYTMTCTNLHRDVRNSLHRRIPNAQFGYKHSQEQYDKFIHDQSLERYTNLNRNDFGINEYENSISCRKILTDPYIHMKLKRNLESDPDFHIYVGAFNDDTFSDRGNIIENAYNSNIVLELCMAGCWISFVLWLLILVVMIVERYLMLKSNDRLILDSENRVSVTASKASHYGSHGAKSSYINNKQLEEELFHKSDNVNDKDFSVVEYYAQDRSLKDDTEVDVDTAIGASQPIGSLYVNGSLEPHRNKGRRSVQIDTTAYKTTLGSQSRI